MILVVDDDEDLRELLASALESHGYPVQQAANGADAIAVIATTSPCLVILDLVMPGMDGWAVVEQMKARGVQDVPVCVISALPDRVPEGVVATLRKPFELRELLAMAQKYCAPHHAAGG